MLRAALALTVLFVAPCALAQQAPAPATPPVGPDWTKVNVTTTDLGNRTFPLLGRAAVDDHRCAVTQERLGDRTPDASRPAADRGDAT